MNKKVTYIEVDFQGYLFCSFLGARKEPKETWLKIKLLKICSIS
jgi:hypothetical protein